LFYVGEVHESDAECLFVSLEFFSDFKIGALFPSGLNQNLCDWLFLLDDSVYTWYEFLDISELEKL
jgi:hypothetical protein